MWGRCVSKVLKGVPQLAVRTTANLTKYRIAAVDVSALFRPGDAAGHLAVGRALSAAFSDTGFAVITGHNVAPERITDLRENAMAFFRQSHEDKVAVNGGSTAGYGHDPYVFMQENGAQLLGDFSRPNDAVESLTYNWLNQPEVMAKLPRNPPGLKEAMLRFNEDTTSLRRALEVACELGLGLEPGYLTERCLKGTQNMRLAYYPDVPSPLPGQMRYGAHVDSFGLIVLSLDPKHPEGLQVQIDGDWVDVPYIENSFVINVGALLSRWTNGTWKASIHRVLCMPGTRLSIVSGAIRPADDVVVEVFPSCAAGPVGALYPPILAREFYAERIALHRPSYLAEAGVVQAASVDGLSQEIRNYQR